ncbi:MAG: hypothetical protein HC853_01955 [Anaerolineae bacterium]|nr:hypothetical protein [Anaerolineae bacterium]
MKLDHDLQKQVSASLLRLGATSPYFATLAMHAAYEQSEEVPTAATDGRTIFINKAFWDKFTQPQQDGLLLHEVLHAALLHVPRRENRDPEIWNIAADAVINGMILREGYKLPEGGIVRPELEHLSTEEAYEKVLREQKQQQQQTNPGSQGVGKDLLDKAPGDAQSNQTQKAKGKPQTGESKSKAKQHADEDFWRAAQEKAQMVSQAAGKMPGNVEREVGELSASRLDWRSYLWRYLTQTPTDFNDFDRRFVGSGLYLDSISGESVQVLVAIDTSGSIDQEAVRVFLSELQGILRAYPQMQCELWYADTELHGPHTLKAHSPLPTPKGGGGTDFKPFFEQASKHRFTMNKTVLIYLTDGYGPFPYPAPKLPTLWVVTPGGLALEKFPFGEVVRLLPSKESPHPPTPAGSP